MVKLETQRHTLQFTFDAGTSRGVMKEREVMFLKIHYKGQTGIGEAAPLPGLSLELLDEIQAYLEALIRLLNDQPKYLQNDCWEELVEHSQLSALPSLQMAVEMALLNLKNQENIWFEDAPLLRNGKSIPINGLIWMNGPEHMYQQGLDKWNQGFNCIKMKIGAIDFNAELEVLYRLRKLADKSSLILRVDANGAFDPKEAFYQLKELAKLDVHSVEQPVAKGQWNVLEGLCENPAIPIALDEELIGVANHDALIKNIKPQYLILKPSLLGGFDSCKKWIAVAEKYGIGWWFTSALESNIGLNAIAQFVSTLDVRNLHQGLGTGSLFKKNIGTPCSIIRGRLFSNVHNPKKG